MNIFLERILAVLCAFVLVGILIAGLWPFHAPRNAVTWLDNANGLRFGNHGTILGFVEPLAPSSRAQAPCSLEIWLKSSLIHDSSTLLAFYQPDSPQQFSLRQSDSDLLLQRADSGHRQRTRFSKMYVPDLFRRPRLVFLTIVSGARGTEIYMDGALARTSPNFRLFAGDFTGQLVIGTSPVVNDSWRGDLRGLAIYRQELTAAQVLHHYEAWNKQGQPDTSQIENEDGVAVYVFDEQRGNVVHNRRSSENNLQIPERYMIVHEKFLEPPWNEFYTGWGYWKNALINIGGFIPLGFFFCAFWSSSRPFRRAALMTVVFGAVVSLIIEVAQAFLPTRDSGTTDVITNTLGTSLGVLLYGWKAAAACLNRILNVAGGLISAAVC